MKKLVTFALIFPGLVALSPAISSALGGEGGGTSTGVGGGGNGIVCFSRSDIPQRIRTQSNGQLLDKYIPFITSIETYDLFEARRNLGWNSTPTKLVDIAPNEDPIEYVERMAKRFELYVPTVSDYLERARSAFAKGGIFNEPFGIEKIEDMVPEGLPGDKCAIVTLARQSGADWSSSRLVLDSRLTDLRTVKRGLQTQLSRAVLQAHEYLYLNARLSYRDSSSDDTRHILALLMREDLTVAQVLTEVAGKFNMTSYPHGVVEAATASLYFDDILTSKGWRLKVEQLDAASEREMLDLFRTLGGRMAKLDPRVFHPQPECVGYASMTRLTQGAIDSFYGCISDVWWKARGSALANEFDGYYKRYVVLIAPLLESALHSIYKKNWEGKIRGIPGINDDSRNSIDNYIASFIKVAAREHFRRLGATEPRQLFERLQLPKLEIDLNYSIPVPRPL